MTTKHPTADQLRSLRDEAYASGDADQVALCDLALEGTIDMDEHPSISYWLATEIVQGRMDGDTASKRCGDVIGAARTSDDRETV